MGPSRLHRGARVRTLTGVVLAATLAACAPKQYTILEGTQPPPSVFTDRMIAGMFATVNYGAVETGRLAAEKALDARVRQFANDMVNDYTAENNRLTLALTSMYNTMEETAFARQLRDNLQLSAETLRLYNGAAFDRTYLDHQIEVHRYMLKALDQAWVALSYDEELEDVLEEARPRVVQHLRHAEELRGSLR